MTEKLENLTREDLENRLFRDPIDLRHADFAWEARAKRVNTVCNRLQDESDLLSLLRKEYLYFKDLGVTSGQYKIHTDKGIEITLTLSIA
jgi:hypothetical protein